MKAKDLKIMRKKLAKANHLDNNPLKSFSKDALTIDAVHRIAESEDESASRKSLSVKLFRSSDVSDDLFEDIFSLFETNMGDMYRNSSWGLDMVEKVKEMKHDKARLLVLIDDDESLAGFVHFRFEHDDEEHPAQAVVYVYEIQIDASYRRQGLGKKMTALIETIALEAEIPKVMLTVFKVNQAAMTFYQQLQYDIDECSPSNHNDPSADYEILSRMLSSTKD
jgi:ribosomal protein S18 acetylase RimI-like enzyme